MRETRRLTATTLCAVLALGTSAGVLAADLGLRHVVIQGAVGKALQKGGGFEVEGTSYDAHAAMGFGRSHGALTGEVFLGYGRTPSLDLTKPGQVDDIGKIDDVYLGVGARYQIGFVYLRGGAGASFWEGEGKGVGAGQTDDGTDLVTLGELGVAFPVGDSAVEAIVGYRWRRIWEDDDNDVHAVTMGVRIRL